jgi:hypothetical protein
MTVATVLKGMAASISGQQCRSLDASLGRAQL